MKKKTVSGVTALTMLASATIPVYATPVEINGSEKKLSNPVSTAEKAVDPMNVYTSFTESVTSNSGNGSAENPYNRFEDAVAQVNDGGTIYIDASNGAFLNDVGGNLPFLIDKNITIKPVNRAMNAELSVRSAGIILGANVKFENITLEFGNKHHDSIFANGHTLDLINVTRANGSREVDLFVGGLYELNGSQVYRSGSNGVINIEVNDSFGGGNLMSAFGNIYAGSMNGTFNGNAEINVSNASSNGSLKKLNIGAIKASGALEADAGNMFDIEEPLPPSENPNLYPIMGNVEVNLHNYQISVDGATGSGNETSVTTSTIYPSNLSLKNVDHLTVKSGHIIAMCDDVATISNVKLKDGTTLDLTKVEKEFTIDNYNGNGIVVLRKNGKLNITNPMNGSIELQTEGAFNGMSGLVEENHVYITTPNEDANITFNPHYAQEESKLTVNKVGDVFEWKLEEPKTEAPPTEEEPPVEEVQPNSEGWLKADNLAQLNYLWNYSIDEDSKTVVLESFKGINGQSDDVKVEIPKTVEGYKVSLANLNTEAFQDVTHIRVAEGEGSVKVLATDLSNGFKDNNTLKYVDLEGLDVSEVDDMSQLFSMCDNLRFIKILDWEIKDTANITAMFYARMSATDDEKKLLVVANDERIDGYDFKASNRIPSVVTYSGEGGHFLGDENILNMEFHRYVIATDDMKELEGLPEHDESMVGTPSREGYKFKGWYTENPTPTNVFELINMTYKAEWEKVETDNGTEMPPNNDNEGEVPPNTIPPNNDNDGDVIQPPTEEPTPQPPVVTPPTNNGGGGSVMPPTNDEEEGVTPPLEDEFPDIFFGIENLEELDKELREKVDSIVAESLVQEEGLTLGIIGDDEDIQHVKQIEVTEEGIFAIVDGKKLKFRNSLEGLDLDLSNARAVRVFGDDKRTVTYKAIPHQSTKDRLKVSSDNLENILITSKVEEPFVDVNDSDWFKEDVEEAFNYVLTTGTTATTYNPYADITRAQFAVMIARALELQPKDSKIELTDIEGKWYQNEAQALYEAGIIKGFNDGTFGGEKKLTRQQAATMMANMLKYTGVDIKVEDDVKFADMNKISEYAQDAVKYLASHDVLVNGKDVKFNPYNNLTRAQMAKMLVRSLRLTDLY